MKNAELSALKGAVGSRLEEKGEFGRVESEMTGLKRRVTKLESRTKIIMKIAGVRPFTDEVGEEDIAFTAKMSAHSFIKADNNLVFDDVCVNIGNCYNNSTGEFVAPFDGLFMFCLTIRAQYHKKISAEMIGNNQVLARATSGYGGIERATASVTVVVKLDANDAVYVKQINEKAGEYHGQGFSTFAGALLVKLK